MLDNVASKDKIDRTAIDILHLIEIIFYIYRHKRIIFSFRPKTLALNCQLDPICVCNPHANRKSEWSGAWSELDPDTLYLRNHEFPH
ncbi:hypothetical protein IP70_13475 [alpha proteobacterium AAP38]|nr:hypothetical protein IP70_13475 [alpha proteobacterium AAP38]